MGSTPTSLTIIPSSSEVEHLPEEQGARGAVPREETMWSDRIAAIAAGCNPAVFGLRGFESLSLHHNVPWPNG